MHFIMILLIFIELLLNTSSHHYLFFYSAWCAKLLLSEKWKCRRKCLFNLWGLNLHETLHETYAIMSSSGFSDRIHKKCWKLCVLIVVQCWPFNDREWRKESKFEVKSSYGIFLYFINVSFSMSFHIPLCD